MKKSLVLFAAVAATNAMPLNAAVIDLFDWGINIDGSTVCPADPDCGSATLPAAVDATGFDFMTGLGTISYTITGDGTGDGAHYTSLYVDHQIVDDPTDPFAGNNFFNEFGSTSGTAAMGQTWEIDEPFVFGDIFTNFKNSSLDNSNGVPSTDPEDVAMALAWGFTLGAGIGAGETATIDFLMAELAPMSGFFLSLTDTATNQTIYFSSTLDIQVNPVPVPGALLLFGSGLVGLTGMCFRRKSQKVEV